MDIAQKLALAQSVLNQEKYDGWLIYDFRRSNPIGCDFLEIGKDELLTRRFFVWISRQGNVHKIIHRIENPLRHIPGEQSVYSSWKELHQILQKLLNNAKFVAMEYSQDAAIPEISRVDGGTIDLIRTLGPTVVSSACILQEFLGIWDSKQLASHYYAAKVLEKTFDDCWDYIRQNIGNITEFDVQKFADKKIEEYGCFSENSLLCAVNHNSANPHYVAKNEAASLIKKGDLVMLDLGCKQAVPRSVYADLTKMAIAAANPSEKQQAVFEIVKKARDAALNFIAKKVSEGAQIRGFEVDDCCRSVICNAGYGAFFTHRTGHNIDEKEHGPGAHIDNLETHDWRILKANSCFSIEPGIYLPNEFGIRLECDVILHPEGRMEVTGGLQDTFMMLF